MNQNNNLKRPFYPQYLSQIVPKKVLSLLLAGLIEQLGAPIIMWEKIGETMTPIYPVKEMSRYPKFCKVLSNRFSPEDLPNSLKFSPQGLELIKKIAKKCYEDSSKRAADLQISNCNDSTKCHCHMGLITCSDSIKIAGRVVAVCTGGKFTQKGKPKDEIRKKVKELGFNEDDLRIFKKLIDDIPEKSDKEIEDFKIQLQMQLEPVKEIAEHYLSKLSEEQEWRLLANLGSRLNRIFLEKGNTLKKKVCPILDEIKCFLHVSYVALFCSVQPGDTVLPLFAQVGFDENEVRNVHFNWEKAQIPIEKDFDSYDWIEKEKMGSVSPSSFLEKGLKGQGRKHFLKAPFLLPYLYGNHYRGLFLIGPFSSGYPKLDQKRINFLCAVGHLVITRILALVAIEALNDRESWRNLMTKLWAHGIRSDLNTLMGEAWELEKRVGSTNFLTKDLDRMRLAIERINQTLEEMKVKAKLTMQAPEAAISPKIDKTELNKQCYPLSVLIYNCTEQVKKLGKRLDIRIQVDDSSIDNLPSSEIDLRLMTLVLKNILDNALKYSQKGKEIRIYGYTDHSKQWAKIIIENYGVGIPKKDYQKIFELCYRSKIVEGEEGVGLGLYQAKRFVELHGGNIVAESRPAFKGASIKTDYITTIIIVLPTILKSLNRSNTICQ